MCCPEWDIVMGTVDTLLFFGRVQHTNMSQPVQLVLEIVYILPSEHHSLASIGSVVILTLQCVIVEQIENEIGISYRPVHIILEEDLWMLHMCVKFVPYMWQRICPVLQFWWRTRFWPSSSHCIFQMLLRVTSGPSQVSKIELKGYYLAS